MTKEFPRAKIINMTIEPSSGYPTGTTRTIPTYYPSSKPIYHTISEPDDLK